RNVSRIKRLDKPSAVAPAQATNVASSTREGEEAAPLEFEAPAAGPAAAAPDSFATASGVPALGGSSTQGGGLLAGGSAPGPAGPGGGGAGLINIGMPGLPPGTIRPADGPIDLPNTPAVPEPGTWAMIALGLLVIIFRARQRR
ncbi:MAG: PEP-CTERM sorting domain-containing protein, partial [Acetobacteraceae bacterium]